MLNFEIVLKPFRDAPAWRNCTVTRFGDDIEVVTWEVLDELRGSKMSLVSVREIDVDA